MRRQQSKLFPGVVFRVGSRATWLFWRHSLLRLLVTDQTTVVVMYDTSCITWMRLIYQMSQDWLNGNFQLRNFPSGNSSTYREQLNNWVKYNTLLIKCKTLQQNFGFFLSSWQEAKQNNECKTEGCLMAGGGGGLWHVTPGVDWHKKVRHLEQQGEANTKQEEEEAIFWGYESWPCDLTYLFHRAIEFHGKNSVQTY